MKNGDVQSWPEANQRYLLAALGVVRALLQAQAAKGENGPQEDTLPAAEQALKEAAAAFPGAPALDALCAAFGLSTFERHLLLLCASVELDSSFAALCAAAQGDPRRTYPTFSLALAAFPGAHWSALTPVGPLRRWRMIELAAAESLTLSPLRVDERVLHYLAGVAYLDDRLRGLIQPAAVPPGRGPALPGETKTPDTEPYLPASQRAVAERIVHLWAHPRPGAGWPAIQLFGAGGANKQAIAAWACASLGLQLQVLRGVDIPAAVAEREALARLWEREAALSGCALLLDCDEVESSEGKRAIAAFVREARGMMIAAAREPLSLGEQLTIRLQVPPLTTAEQHALWQCALGPRQEELCSHVGHVASQFNLSLPGIQAVSAEVLGRLAAGNEQAPEALLWEACRAQARPRLEDLAQRLEPIATWDDLVLPEGQIQTLRQLAAHVRYRDRVYHSWGFAAKSARGLGISALFAGTSGTGKTMAAEVLANELRLDLYRIDLSQVVSKYIGETEKNLRRVFDAAEEGGAILLFDEADALFGKRSEVKDSHDRYANIEVSYLLQRMESYQGLAILTTNMKQALDSAFLRRLRFIVPFPFPDAALRGEIWRRVFPAATPTNGLRLDKLARLNVAGGNIRNIALNAAFLAADTGEPVGMTHLLQAARSEYAKMEKPLTEAEIGGWV